MSDHYSLTTEDNSIIWKNQLSRPSLNYSNVTEESLNNESYVTAVGDDENETQYLSVLETNSDVTLEELHDITLSNGKLSVGSSHLDIPSDNVEEVQSESQDQQVVVFSIDGSDDLYGIQFAQDEDGNIQKYQFKFRTTEDGQLEAMPETIQLLPNDNEVQEESKEDLIYDETNVQESQQSSEEPEGESHLFLHEENLIENVGFVRNRNVEIVEENSEELIIANENENHHVDEDFQPEGSSSADQLKMNSNYMVFVKGEPEQVVEEEFQEDEFDHNEHIEEDIDHSQHNADIVKSELFEEESNDLLDNTLNDDTELIHENEEVESIENEIQEENVDEHQLEGEGYPGLQVQNEVTVLEYQQCLTEDSVPLEDADEALSNGSFESLFLEKSPENENESEDTETYETVEGLHVTADEELIEETFEVAQPVFQQSTKKSYVTEPLNIANQQPKPLSKGAPKKNKTILYYFMQKQEKENVNSVPLNAICKSPMKTHPRSILRCDVELRVIGDDEKTIKSERGKSNKAAIRADRVILEKRQQEVTDKRFARSKKAVEERLFNNFISKTTIPHAPVRQTRLPRKQEIKPVDTRRNEEIIVQEVMVSSKGFVEDAEERLKNKDKFEVTTIVELSDSEDEAVVKTVKKRPKKSTTRSSSVSSNNSDASIIEIIHSDEENKPKTNNEMTKRGRGRPRKNTESPGENKRSRSGTSKMQQSPTGKEDGSPSKKSRTDSSEAESDGGKKEIICPLCPKSFPSQNSLNTHIHHHNLENSLRNNTKLVTGGAPVMEYKHKCENCKMTFKNRILLKRHECKKKQSHLDCSLCTKSFKDTVMLNIHKKSHIKQNLIKNTVTVTVSPKKILPKLSTSKFKSPRKFLSTYRCKDCPKICSTQTMLAAHERTHKKFNCSTCKSSFSSRLLLDTHLRVSCVKTASPKDRRLSFKIRRSFVHSPRRPSMSRKSMVPTSANMGANKSALSNSSNTGKKLIPDTAAASRKSMVPGLASSSKKGPTISSRRSFIPGSMISSRKSVAPGSSTGSRRSLMSSSTAVPKKSLMSGSKTLNESSNTGTSDVNQGLNTSTMSRFLDVKAQCDSCPLKFTTLAALFKHKVKDHGLSTPDKNLLKPEKQLLHKPKVTHGGIPAHDRLRKAFSNYRAQFQESCIEEKL